MNNFNNSLAFVQLFLCAYTLIKLIVRFFFAFDVNCTAVAEMS